MRNPVAVLKDSLGELNNVTVLGAQFRLSSEVALDSTADMEELLLDNVERLARWDRMVAECRLAVSEAEDELEDLKASYFGGYWDAMEEKERAEMKAQVHDETELAEDAADKDAGDKTFAIRRRRRHAERVTSGPAAGRWRRNFSDDLIRAHVNRTPQVITAKKTLRDANYQLELAKTVHRVLEHRSRVISHLCAIHRDNTRR